MLRSWHPRCWKVRPVGAPSVEIIVLHSDKNGYGKRSTLEDIIIQDHTPYSRDSLNITVIQQTKVVIS